MKIYIVTWNKKKEKIGYWAISIGILCLVLSSFFGDNTFTITLRIILFVLILGGLLLLKIAKWETKPTGSITFEEDLVKIEHGLEHLSAKRKEFRIDLTVHGYRDQNTTSMGDFLINGFPTSSNGINGIRIYNISESYEYYILVKSKGQMADLWSEIRSFNKG